MSWEKTFKVSILWRGDAEARQSATPQNNRFYRIFEELAAVGIHAEPGLRQAFADKVREQLLKADGVLVWVDQSTRARPEAHSTRCCATSPRAAPGWRAPRRDPQDGGQRSPVPDKASWLGYRFVAAYDARTAAKIGEMGLVARVREQLQGSGFAAKFRRAVEEAVSRERVTNLFGQHVPPTVVDRLLRFASQFPEIGLHETRPAGGGSHERTRLESGDLRSSQKSDFQTFLDYSGIVKRQDWLENRRGRWTSLHDCHGPPYPALNSCYRCVSRTKVLRRPGCSMIFLQSIKEEFYEAGMADRSAKKFSHLAPHALDVVLLSLCYKWKVDP